ncbi:MAG: bifunctional metallophosphatase/5'-nucleotidase [Acidobacteria bacterium]|nr:MAG: bifunctional metallophosphatase/5'-nucleotidase [Acidobacteriota bacterium]
MKKIVLLLLFAALPLPAQTTVTLLHFSDYHSHALPFYTDEGERGGIARAIHYLQREKQKGALVFSGGDTMNKGAPAWSDKYTCAEWPWWNGIVDAMAFGNHDADYGLDAFALCRQSVTYPILSANTSQFPRYQVFTVKGIRIGVFAVAGSDFKTLVHVEGFSFGDPFAAARDVVRELREKEHVDAVVMIGHQHSESDEEMARTIPGIDLIFGSHSHLKREFLRIDKTQAYSISPWQYLGYISRVQMTFDKHHKLTHMTGTLVPVDAGLGEDKKIAARVQTMERDLERDPAYADLFKPIATLAHPMSISDLASFTLDQMRRVANADVALSTISSFRAALPGGPISFEKLRDALPYENDIVVCTMNGADVHRVLDYSAARKGTDRESFIAAPATLDPSKMYRVATTDFLANVVYREVFNCEKEKTGKKVRETVKATLSP